MSKTRKISYCEALNEAMFQEMERDPAVFVYGIGVPDHKKVFGSTIGLVEKFGDEYREYVRATSMFRGSGYDQQRLASSGYDMY